MYKRVELENTPQLTMAYDIAYAVHAGQMDKLGVSYIQHVLDVVYRCGGLSDTISVTALLHDVVEDTGMTLRELKTYGFTPEVVDAVQAVTRVPGEKYFAYIHRVAAHPVGRIVKHADLMSNTDPVRVQALPEDKRGLQKRYRKAIEIIEQASWKACGRRCPREDAHGSHFYKDIQCPRPCCAETLDTIRFCVPVIVNDRR